MTMIQKSQIFGQGERGKANKNIQFANEMENGEGREENIWRGKIFFLCSTRGPSRPKNNKPEQLCFESAQVACVCEQVGCVCE